MLGVDGEVPGLEFIISRAAAHTVREAATLGAQIRVRFSKAPSNKEIAGYFTTDKVDGKDRKGRLCLIVAGGLPVSF